ncbi:Lymphatic vessel endothelial hyaluronic acid receptor 1 [Bagarius yarrelli]|uniref:Lymphatic vessel endothelial hyaluronic acid receptor 1 n=1 Tax=Bagarius yarrelli TaxID=175774 RepID=A0A556V9Z2_BAGYA|nr:Lymphatic vessel endothelial hyaluronic acid receptor 1 [Bagarius yarrelli]
MADSRMLLLLVAQFVSSVLLIDVSQIEVYPKHGSVSGVFHAGLSGVYAFNASVAREVCERLGVAMADKPQVEKALALGLQTCRFGWIDEQVVVIPRIQAKASCGQGGLGIITWRAALSSEFDVFCFNSTDYEAGLNAVQENPSTAAASTAQTSGAHPRLGEEMTTSVNSPGSVNDSPESQANRRSPTTAVGLIALLTTVFAFLLLAVAAICYLKKNNVSRWNKRRQKENTETHICEKTEKEFQAEVKNQHNTTSNTNTVSVTIRLEKETEAATDRPSL